MIVPHGLRSAVARRAWLAALRHDGCVASQRTTASIGGVICFTASSTLMMPAGKALLNTCVNTSFGLPLMTWTGMPK